MANRAERRKALQEAHRLARAKGEDRSMQNPVNPDDQAVAKLPFYETNLFWGSVGVLGISISIVLTVIAAMLHDIRWLLMPAGLTGIISVACFRKVFNWSYWFVAFGSAVVVASLIDVNLLVKPSSASVEQKQSDHAPTDEAIALNKFISGKDEFQLQQFFAFDTMRDLNIRIAQDKLQLDMANRTSQFNYEPYRNGGSRALMMDTLIANPAVQGGGLNADARPFEIAVIVLPEQYSENKDRIEKFMRSGVLPTSIRSPLEQFDSILNDDASALIRVLNDASHNHRDQLVYNDDLKSPFWKTVDKSYHDHFVALQPQVSTVLSAIRKFLGL